MLRLNPQCVCVHKRYNSICLSLPGREKAEKKQAAASQDEAQVDVSRLDLRVGRIITAQQLPDTDSLYMVKVDVGEASPRTVVSEQVKFVPVDQVQYYFSIICVVGLKIFWKRMKNI